MHSQFLLCGGPRIATAAAEAALIGEAGNIPKPKFGPDVMFAIACVIRQRGSLQGIYGANNPVVKHVSAKLRARAAHAWLASSFCLHPSAITRGCAYFGCPTDARYFRHILQFKPVFATGTITFYKP